MMNHETAASTFSGDLVRPRWFYRQWMLAGNPAYFFDRLTQDCGDFVHYRGLLSFYLVNHPILVKEVLLKTHSVYDKRSVIYDRFRNAFGNGLVVAEGEHWRRQRKLMQPMFGPLTVRQFFDTMTTEAIRISDQWRDRCARSEVFDIAHEMEQVTLRIAGRVLFSDGFENVCDQISRWTSVINRYSAKPPLPIIRQYWFPSSINRDLRRTLHEFHDFIGDMIAQRRVADTSQDLLSILLHAKHEGGETSMSDVEIAEEVLGMIIGGHETSSSALTWLWYELARHPEYERQLHQEIERVVGDEPVQLEHLPQLKFAKMLIDECLRLHPPFWFENRNVMQDTELGGHRLPKGSLVVMSRYSLHRHRDFWTSPNEFRPRRQDPDQPENSRSSYAQIPFGGGPRICIGIHFATMELIIILVVIARQYRVVIDASDRHAMSAQLTMAPKFGVRVRLSQRDNTSTR